MVLPSERKEIPISPETLTKYTGSYTITPVNIYYTMQTSILNIYLENDHLAIQITNQPKIKLFSASETKFFSRIPDVEIEFFTDEKDKAIRLVLQQDGDRSIGVKTL